MKTVAFLFGVLAIYFVAFAISGALFGEGDVGRVVGGLLGTVVVVGMTQAIEKKDE
ncbi:hypothetical protein GCM10007918_17270 [Piscinibacter gummiphilus]|nr:hypothetical protein GCM10007918_17270 [Piscinibacter gummiphilus]